MFKIQSFFQKLTAPELKNVLFPENCLLGCPRKRDRRYGRPPGLPKIDDSAAKNTTDSTNSLTLYLIHRGLPDYHPHTCP
jgi:hypothetical protein